MKKENPACTLASRVREKVNLCKLCDKPLVMRKASQRINYVPMSIQDGEANAFGTIIDDWRGTPCVTICARPSIIVVLPFA